MAIIWAEGFEEDDTDTRGTALNVSLSTAYGTNGRRGCLVGDNHNAYSASPAVPVASGGENSIWWHCKIQVKEYVSQLVHYHNSTPETTMYLTGPSGQWQILNYNGVTDSAAFGTFAIDTWYEVFIEKVYHASTGSFKVWINDSLELNLTSLNTGTIPSTTSMLAGGNGGSDVNSMWVMDMVMGDGSDSPNAALTFPLSLEAHTLLPDDNGNTSGLTGSDTNQVDNYLLVDESDPDTADWCGSGTEGDLDTYSMGDLASTTETIIGVIAEAVSAKSDSGAKYMRPVIRTSATDYPGDSVALSETYVMQRTVWDENPNTVSPWTGSEVNGIEVGAEVRDS
jgi:hypothetical protein